MDAFYICTHIFIHYICTCMVSWVLHTMTLLLYIFTMCECAHWNVRCFDQKAIKSRKKNTQPFSSNLYIWFHKRAIHHFRSIFISLYFSLFSNFELYKLSNKIEKSTGDWWHICSNLKKSRARVEKKWC